MNNATWPRRRTSTLDDLGKPAPSLWWQYLRSLRASPPGFAGSGRRASVFRAAVGQSEQLFRAAAAVDYSARPILAYYGLAQACLAIIQASPRMEKSDTQPTGHGMRWDRRDEGLGVVVDDATERGLLRLTTVASGSGGIGASATIDRMWSTLPEIGRDLGQGIDVTLRPWWVSSPVSDSRSEMNVSVEDASLLRDDFESTRATLIEARPSLAEFNPQQGRSGSNWHTKQDSGGFTIYFPGVDKGNADRLLTLNNHYYDTRSPRLYASLDGVSPVHPIVVWLAVLFGLSMIARYHPERWVQLLNVDASPDAPMLEDILQRANVVCPGLILNTLDHMGVLYHAGVRPVQEAEEELQ